MSLMNPMNRFWDYLAIVTVVGAVGVGVLVLVAFFVGV